MGHQQTKFDYIHDNTDPEVMERHIKGLVSFTVHRHLKYDDIM